MNGVSRVGASKYFLCFQESRRAHTWHLIMFASSPVRFLPMLYPEPSPCLSFALCNRVSVSQALLEFKAALSSLSCNMCGQWCVRRHGGKLFGRCWLDSEGMSSPAFLLCWPGSLLWWLEFQQPLVDCEVTLCLRWQYGDTEAHMPDDFVVCVQLVLSYVKEHNFTCVSHCIRNLSFSSWIWS